jgi:hypothetical protein
VREKARRERKMVEKRHAPKQQVLMVDTYAQSVEIREMMAPYVQNGLSSSARRRARSPACTLHPSAYIPHAAHVAHVLQLARVRLHFSASFWYTASVGSETRSPFAPATWFLSTNGRASGPPASWADACMSSLSCRTKWRSGGRPAPLVFPQRALLCLRAPRTGNARSPRPSAARDRGAAKIALPTPVHNGR